MTLLALLHCGVAAARGIAAHLDLSEYNTTGKQRQAEGGNHDLLHFQRFLLVITTTEVAPEVLSLSIVSKAF